MIFNCVVSALWLGVFIFYGVHIIFGTERFFLTFFRWFLGPFEYYVGGGNDDIDSVRNHTFDVKEK